MSNESEYLTIKNGILVKCDPNATEIIIPDVVYKIGELAFCGCKELACVNIPESVKKIDIYAFFFCNSLISVTIPGSVTEISYESFRNCQLLKSVTISNGVKIIGVNAFKGCKSLTSVNISESVTEIGSGAFWGCKSLESVNISEGIMKIGDSAFKGCQSLISVNISETVTEIGEEAFKGCKELMHIIIPKSVMKIGKKAFLDCKSLVSVSIPVSIRQIGYSAFDNCISLTSVTIYKSGNKINGIGNWNADYTSCTSLAEINYYGTRAMWFMLGGFKLLPQYFISEKCFELKSANVVVHCVDGDAIDPRTLTEYSIPDGVTEFSRETFSDCKSLVSVTIPNSVMKIGYKAFRDCLFLSEINYNGTKSQWVLLNGFDAVFKDTIVHCSDGDAVNPIALTKEQLSLVEKTVSDNDGISDGDVYYHKEDSVKQVEVTEYVISDGTMEIGSYEFFGYRSLISVTIPESVKEIGEYAFSGCKSLVEIKFGGTKDQWTNVEKGDGWKKDTPALVVHCVDGDIKL